MKKTALAILAGLLVVPTVALSHPVDETYDTRGECERAFAESSKLDRERLVQNGNFPTIGAAQSTFQTLFTCEYDPDEDVWYMELHLPPLDNPSRRP